MNDLRILGFTDQESRTYLHLLEQGPKSVLDLAATLGMDARDVREATDALIDIGMAISSSTGDTVITPINPHAALERLTHEKNSELLRSVMATESAYTAYLRHVQIPAHNEPNEILTGPQIIVRIRQMERMAAKEVLRLRVAHRIQRRSRTSRSASHIAWSTRKPQSKTPATTTTTSAPASPQGRRREFSPKYP
jgi:sugar-specific transcriptional regulator TrmB